jgi:spermidine/putrescine-binding protein
MRFWLAAAIGLLMPSLAMGQPVHRRMVGELFTSAGYSSCLPAHAKLPELAQPRPDLLLLTFHVTSWSNLGWHDPYSFDVPTQLQLVTGREANTKNLQWEELAAMSNYNVTRRGVLRAGAAGLGAIAAGNLDMISSAAYGRSFKGESLRIFTYAGAWGDQFTKNFAPLFKKMTGADLVVELGWWDSIPKLKASPPGSPAFDLIMTDATQGYPAIHEELFQKVNMANIPNARLFTPEVLDNWVVKENWGVTWPDAAQTGIYNKTLVKQPPARWGDLLKPEFDGQLGIYNSFYFSLFTFACMKVDSEGKAGTARKEIADNLEGVLDFAIKQRNRVKYWWPSSSDMALNLLGGNVSAGNIHTVDIIPVVRAGKPVDVFVPDHDRASFQALWLVSKGTKKKELAEAAINIFCSEQFQKIYASDGGFPTAIPTVAAEVAATDPVWALMYAHKPEQFKDIGYYPYDAYFAHWDHIVDVWDKKVLRKA